MVEHDGLFVALPETTLMPEGHVVKLFLSKQRREGVSKPILQAKLNGNVFFQLTIAQAKGEAAALEVMRHVIAPLSFGL